MLSVREKWFLPEIVDLQSLTVVPSMWNNNNSWEARRLVSVCEKITAVTG